ncbi:hypothetical protein GW750_09055 [bacterium]|nr:hypothetical protein [bacterium]
MIQDATASCLTIQKAPICHVEATCNPQQSSTLTCFWTSLSTIDTTLTVSAYFSSKNAFAQDATASVYDISCVVTTKSCAKISCIVAWIVSISCGVSILSAAKSNLN